MKIPVIWLREYVDVPEDQAGLEAFCEVLTMAGLEVEEILESPVGPTLYTKITPNRGDWASVFGTAREAAAAGKLSLRALPEATSHSAESEIRSLASVTIEDAENCPRYTAKVIRGVKIGPSPQWMQDRLTAAGMRPVSNVVDITNYVMLELGQPLHAFDLDTLPEGKIVVRQAREGEKILTLDGTERELPSGTLCICDAEKPIAVAGVMGGGPTEVTESTTNLLLESAHFDPFSIRRTSKRLSLQTEASYRYERYVDPALVPIAAERAAQLFAELAGGTVVPGMIDVYPTKKAPRRILARVDRIRKLLGADVDRDEMIAGLERLGIMVDRSAGSLDCGIPSWRPDLTMEDDIAEEVGRVSLGYENLPETVPPLLEAHGGDSPRGRFRETVREGLVRDGMQEVQSHSLTAPSPLATDTEVARRVMVRSALSPELSSLRTSLLPNLLQVTARGYANGLRDIAVFEVGPVYLKAESGSGYVEPLRISGVITGSAMPTAWLLKPESYPADFYFAKGVIENLLMVRGISGVTFTPTTHPITHGGRTAAISVNGLPVGLVAELSEATVEAQNLPRRTYVFELEGEVLLQLAGDAAIRYTPLARYPAVTRDLAPVFPTTVPYADIERTAREAAGPLLESLRLTDVYTGSNVAEGTQALTLRLTFRSSSATLKDTEVEATLGEVRASLTALGGDFRDAHN